MIGRYFVRLKADQDLDEQAEYLATHANPEIGHRFLMAAHETFALLASEPGMAVQAQASRFVADARLPYVGIRKDTGALSSPGGRD